MAIEVANGNHVMGTKRREREPERCGWAWRRWEAEIIGMECEPVSLSFVLLFVFVLLEREPDIYIGTY